MGKRESKVETYLDTEVKKLGGITRKWVCPGRSGVPDRIVIVRGIVFFVEVKTMDGTVEPWQKREMDKLNESGALTLVVRGRPGVDDFVNILDRLITQRELKNGK